MIEEHTITELTPEQFRAWLEGKPKDEIVGSSCYATLCPIATYLRRSCGYLVAEAWRDVIVINSALHVPTPEWAEKFIRRADKEHTVTFDVTAEIALKFLHEVLE